MKAFIKAIRTYLPEKIEFNDPTQRLTKKTGILERHIAAVGECASDMAQAAAERLFEETSAEREDVDYLLFCTQSPDYFLPTTACLLQARLGLPQTCGALDFNLGCSGYVYGLSLAKGLIESGQAKNVLLLTAETYSKFIHSKDGTVQPLFGDGASATLVSGEMVNEEGIFAFHFGTDGRGAESLMVPVGGARNPTLETPLEEIIDKSGNVRTNHSLYMNGAEISNFAMQVVPQTVETVLQKANLSREQVDYFVFHQANRFMLEFLQQKCNLQNYPYWNDPALCGNTVSTSIPLALWQLLQTRETDGLGRVMLAGFGVGLSWAGCMIDLRRMGL